MRYVAGAAILALAVFCPGCRDQPPKPPAVTQPPVTNAAGDAPAGDPDSRGNLRQARAVITYNTGDLPNWPCYDLPLEHTFDAPEVPPEILGPFP